MSLKNTPLRLLLGLGLIFVFNPSTWAMGLKPSNQPKGVVYLFEREHLGLSQFFYDSTLLKIQYTQFRRQIRLDTTQTRIEIRELLYNKDYRLPLVVDLDFYIRSRLEFDNSQTWKKIALKNVGKLSQAGASGIELNIPVKIKSKAFKRIFGGDRVGLRVTGNISFELAGRSESREGSAVSSYQQRGNFSPRFKQTQQFQVEGKVGDKVSVKVDQNSEATFDF